MYVFVGLWRPKPAWTQLGKAERVRYLATLSASNQARLGAQAEVLAWGANEHATSENAYRYFAVWRFPSAELARVYEDTLREHGWDMYFETVSVSGRPMSPFDTLTRHVIDA